jgi:hypothetical protein
MDFNPNAKDEGHSAERALGYTWCLWEKYQEAFVQTTTNYDKNLFVIYSFDSLEKLALLWKHTTYSKPSKLFYDIANEVSKKVVLGEDEGEDKVVDGLFLFRKGIEPKWEDPANERGCDIWCELSQMNAAEIDKFWHDIVFAVAGQNFPFSDYVNGFRILDRMKKHGSIKFELWISCGLGGHKAGSEEFLRNEKIIQAILEHTHRIVSGVKALSIYQITKKEHFVANKVN